MSFQTVTGGLALVLALTLPNTGQAQSIETAVEQALARDAGLLVLRQRADALGHLAVADGALPDPEVTIAAEGLPADDPLGADMMTMYRIGVRQRFPAGDSRQLATERRRSEAEAVRADLEARTLEVTEQTRLAWLDWASATAAADRIEAMIGQLDQLVEITRRRFAAGTGRLQDEAQALLEMTLLERRQVDAQTAIDEARARLERWTGRWPHSAGTPVMPAWRRPIFDGENLKARLADHPELIAARIRTRTEDIRVDLARQAYRPQWMLEGGYGHQRGNDPSGRRMSDKLFAMATLSLPLFTANRQDQRVDAALAERDARHAETQLILQQLSGELDRQDSLLKRLDQRRQLLEERILPQAQATVEATLSAYESDRASFDELIRARLRWLELELDLIDTRRRELATFARIASLTDKELP
ncbi:MAG: TolC family protein [Wenzhouxiangella sp.]